MGLALGARVFMRRVFTVFYFQFHTQTHTSHALDHVRLPRSILRQAFVVQRDASKAVGGVQGCFLQLEASSSV